MLELIFAVIILVIFGVAGFIASRVADQWDGEDY